MKSYSHLCLKERICIDKSITLGKNIVDIAKELGRNKSTIIGK